jgi:hypothetical protein
MERGRQKRILSDPFRQEAIGPNPDGREPMAFLFTFDYQHAENPALLYPASTTISINTFHHHTFSRPLHSILFPVTFLDTLLPVPKIEFHIGFFNRNLRQPAVH